MSDTDTLASLDFAMHDIDQDPMPLCGNCQVEAKASNRARTLTCPQCGYTLTKATPNRVKELWIRLNLT